MLNKIGSWFSNTVKEVKAWIKSKTIWFSVVGVPAILQTLSYAQETLPLVRDNLGASYALTSFVIGVAGILLRKLTTKPLSEK